MVPVRGTRDDEIGTSPRRAHDGTRATTAGPRATKHRGTRRDRRCVRVRPRARRTSAASDARGGVSARVGGCERLRNRRRGETFIRLFFSYSSRTHHASTGSRTSRLANARGVAAPTASTVPIVFEALSRLARNAAWVSRAAPASPRDPAAPVPGSTPPRLAAPAERSSIRDAAAAAASASASARSNASVFSPRTSRSISWSFASASSPARASSRSNLARRNAAASSEDPPCDPGPRPAAAASSSASSARRSAAAASSRARR